MNTAVANPLDPVAAAALDEFRLRKFLIYSLILHGLLVVSIAASIYIKFQGDRWGGVGGTDGAVTKVNLVGPPPGIPLPPRPSVPDSAVADPSLSLFREQPIPKPLPQPEPPKPAAKIAPFKYEKPLPPTHRSKRDQPKTPPPDNIVPGKGAPPQMPTNYSAQPPGSGSGPIVVQPGQGGGDFALKYAWYVEAVRRRISQNWIQGSIDPAVRAARQAHTVMTFTINRDGSVSNVQLAQSSGNLSMDNSARRALEGIQFGPLPNDFNGSRVQVTFDFDLALTH